MTPGGTLDQRPRVLLVEDEALIALHLQNLLEIWRYDVVATAESAAEAVERATRHRPDLVLMDIRLKEGSSGIDAAQAILAQRIVPIIFVTGNGDPATLAAAAAIPHAGVVLKPFHPAELKTVMERALAG